MPRKLKAKDIVCHECGAKTFESEGRYVAHIIPNKPGNYGCPQKWQPVPANSQ